jgi:hypothetical protein
MPQFRARQLITQTSLKKGTFWLQRAKPSLGCRLSVTPNSRALSRSYMDAKDKGQAAHPFSLSFKAVVGAFPGLARYQAGPSA